MPEPVDDSQDAWSAWAAQVIDLYVECAQRHKALSDWARGK
jgi:hypothetical protein